MSEAFLCRAGSGLIKKLWENPSPSSAFETQELEVPGINTYDAVMVRFGFSTAYPDDCLCVWLFYNAGSTYSAAFAKYPTNNAYRSVTVRNTISKVGFGDAVESSAGNRMIIPMAIYGLKF